MSKKIKVIVARVGQDPVVEEIDDTLEAMQEIVGGYIECVRLSPTVDMWLNEEGRLTGLPFNRLVPDVHGNQWDILGNLFLTSHDDEGEITSLSADDLTVWMDRIKGAPTSL